MILLLLMSALRILSVTKPASIAPSNKNSRPRIFNGDMGTEMFPDRASTYTSIARVERMIKVDIIQIGIIHLGLEATWSFVLGACLFIRFLVLFLSQNRLLISYHNHEHRI